MIYYTVFYLGAALRALGQSHGFLLRNAYNLEKETQAPIGQKVRMQRSRDIQNALRDMSY